MSSDLINNNKNFLISNSHFHINTFFFPSFASNYKLINRQLARNQQTNIRKTTTTKRRIKFNYRSPSGSLDSESNLSEWKLSKCISVSFHSQSTATRKRSERQRFTDLHIQDNTHSIHLYLEENSRNWWFEGRTN